MTAPAAIRLVDLAPRWASATGEPVGAIARDLARWFDAPTPEGVAELAAAADRAEAEAAAVKARAEAGQLEAWFLEHVAVDGPQAARVAKARQLAPGCPDALTRIARRARAEANRAAAILAAAPVEPTLAEAWVAVSSLGPGPTASQYRVRRHDLRHYFDWLVSVTPPLPPPARTLSDLIRHRKAQRAAAAPRPRSAPVPPWLGPDHDVDGLYDPARVWLSIAWLRREFAERLGALPAFLATAALGDSGGRPDAEAAQAELSLPEQRLRRIEAWLRAEGVNPLAVERGDKARARRALMAEGMDDDAFNRAWQYGRDLTPPRIHDAPRKPDAP